jgi:riboflavin synthase
VFTGIVETLGTVRQIGRHARGGRIEIAAAAIAAAARPGDSLAVDGACLTVTAATDDGVTCDLSPETLSRTTLGALRAGARVNLERPLQLGAPVGGHLVSGHVDGVGRLVTRVPQSQGALLRIRVPDGLGSLLVPKGSIAVDGVSLTVAALSGPLVDVAVIPYTLRTTTLRDKRTGARLNLEADLIGKYVARLAGGGTPEYAGDGLTWQVLKEHGFA